MRSLSFLLVFFSFALARLGAADAPAAPEAVVAALYKAHASDKGPFFQSEDKAVVSKYFSKELTAFIWVDAKNADGEVGALGADPLYDAQDTEIKKFAIEKGKIDGTKATVLVTFVNFDEKQKFTYQMVQENGAWKIADIRYTAGHTLKKLYQDNAEALK